MHQEGVSQIISVVGFRKIEKPAEISLKVANWGIQQYLINLVVLDYGGTQQQRKKLKQIQTWARSHHSEDIRLARITKQQAFLQTYREMINSPVKTYFLTCQPIEQITKEPLQQYYQKLPAQESSLEKYNKEAEANLRRIAFIIFRDSLQNLDKRNYFHANVALITSETTIVKELIEQNLSVFLSLRPKHSTSSINSEEAHHFEEQLKQVAKIIPVKSDQSQIDMSSDYQAVKLLNNTPGVGTYL